MADDWEAEDWEAEDFKPQLPARPAAVAPAEYETIGQATLARANEPDMSKFEDEDKEVEPEPEYKIKPQPKKKVEKKYEMGEEVEAPLDDPIAEKLRRQRLEEEADFRAAQELFGGGGSGGGRNPLDSMLPKTAKDFQEYANALTNRYILPHAGSKNFKAFAKALLRAVAEPLSAEDAKELESAAATVRADKVKAEKEKAAAAAKGAKGKKSINVGRAGASAGLDDYIYDDDGLDDGDFM